jgi:hypothetical protein
VPYGLGVPDIFPPLSSASPATPSLHRVPSSSVPRLHRYYESLRLPTIRPGRLVSSPSGTIPCSLLRSQHRQALPVMDQGFGLPAPLPADSGWRQWGLPGSWRTLDRMPCFYDSGGPAVPGHSSIGDVAFPLHVQGRRPRKVISELSTQPTISLSTLHPFGYPRGARLASGWRPPLAGRDSYPQGPFERFPRLRCHL